MTSPIYRYFFVGAISACIDLFLFLSLVKFFSIHWFLAGCIGFIFATLVNYFLSIRYVFVSNARFNKKINELSVIYLISIGGLMINQLVLFLVLSLFINEFLLSKLLASACAFIWNYSLRSQYVFKSKE